jgi:uncharacterized protein (UPF0548 family)
MATGSLKVTLQKAATALPTYDGPEALDLDVAPAGFALDRYDAVVGRGPADFDRARLGLQTWATHQVRGVGVQPPSKPVSLGAMYLVTLGTPFVSIAAPCRVTRVTDEAEHWGFSYRTLPGHPELGEEAFDVRIDEGGDVHLGITAVSRHAGLVMRIAGPAARVVQRRVTRAYGRALRDFVAARP